MRRLICTVLMVLLFFADSGPIKTQEEPNVQIEIQRCFTVGTRAKRLCELQLESTLVTAGGGAALACIAGLPAGALTAALICLVALGISLVVALNALEQYNICIENAVDAQTICIETVCT